MEDLLGRHNAVLSDLTELRDAVRSIRDVKGRHHTQLAYERLIALLPENVKSGPTDDNEEGLK